MKWTALAVFLLSTAVQAQDTPAPPSTDGSESQRAKPHETRGLCFPGHPLTACRSFLVVEAEAGFRILNRRDGSRLDGYVIGGDVGWMRNLNSRSAIGGALGIDNQYVTLGPRYRRWLSEAAALDVGLSAAWDPGRIEIIELRTAVMLGDRAGVWVNTSHDFGRGQSGMAVGVQAGSEPALGILGVATLTLIGVLATWESD